MWGYDALLISWFINIRERSLFVIVIKIKLELLHHIGVKLLTWLRLKFSPLNVHKFDHKFRDCVSPMCNCGAKTETTKPFFLALPITCQWKTKSPWRPSSDRSFCYKFWWTISMKYCNVSDEFNDKIMVKYFSVQFIISNLLNVLKNFSWLVLIYPIF